MTSTQHLRSLYEDQIQLLSDQIHALKVVRTTHQPLKT
jgi:hypothetical protein